MKKPAFWVVGTSIVALIGCGDYSGSKQASASPPGGQSANFGSATDIAKGSDLPSNSDNGADIGIGGPIQRESGNYQAQSIATRQSDEEMAKQIKVALTTGSTGTTGAIPENVLTKIDVQAHLGNVTLSGPVSSEDKKKTIGQQVARFKGVRSVQNNLTVGGSARNEKPLQPLVPRTRGNN